MTSPPTYDDLVVDKHPLPVAGVLALASLPIHLLLPLNVSQALAAGVMCMIAGIYVGFAALDGRRSRLLIEGAVALSFTVASIAALLANPLLIALVYIAHGFWDAAHHKHGLQLSMPAWYVRFCAAYDVLAGIGLWLIWTYLSSGISRGLF